MHEANLKEICKILYNSSMKEFRIVAMISIPFSCSKIWIASPIEPFICCQTEPQDLNANESAN